MLVQVPDDDAFLVQIHRLADKALLVEDKLVDVDFGQRPFPAQDVLGDPFPLHGFHLLDVVPELSLIHI